MQVIILTKVYYIQKIKEKTWNQSNIKSGRFECLVVVNNTVIAGSWYNKGLLYSEDKGKTWKESNINTGDFICLTTIGDIAIAGSRSDNGLYYSEDNGKT